MDRLSPPWLQSASFNKATGRLTAIMVEPVPAQADAALLLFPIDSNGQSHRFLFPPRTRATKSISVPVNGAKGLFLISIDIDGVATRLNAHSAGRYIGPKITI